jgi:hypothetical protein
MKAKTIEQLTEEFSAIIAENKPAFLRMFVEDVMGIEFEVGDADLAGNMLPTGKKYRMNGFGSSISIMIGKGIKGKKYVDAAGAAINEFKRKIQPELERAYPEAEVGPLLLQDITVNEFLQHEAGKWFANNNVKVDYFTRLD